MIKLAILGLLACTSLFASVDKTKTITPLNYEVATTATDLKDSLVGKRRTYIGKEILTYEEDIEYLYASPLSDYDFFTSGPMGSTEEIDHNSMKEKLSSKYQFVEIDLSGYYKSITKVGADENRVEFTKSNTITWDMTSVFIDVKNLQLPEGSQGVGNVCIEGTRTEGDPNGKIINFYAYVDSNLVPDGTTVDVPINVDSAPTIDQILEQVTAEDLLGEAVEVTCSEDERAKYKPGTLGTYKVEVTATDKYGQTAHCFLNLKVIDIVAPTIKLKSNLNYNIGESINATSLKEKFTLADNGTSHGGSIGEPKFELDSTLLSGDKTFGASDIGTHTLKVTVADSSGNTNSKEFSLVVVDNIPPVITMKDGAEGKVTVGLSRVLSLKQNEFLQLFEATDNVTASSSLRWGIEGEFIPSLVGKHTVKVTCTDAAGNMAVYPVEVTVDADLPPVFILGDALVGATNDNPLSSAQLQKIVTHGLYAARNVRSVLIDDTEYQKNATKAGRYSVPYSVEILEEDQSITKESGVMTISVSDTNGSEEEDQLSGWTKFWQCFKNWFRGVFTKFKFDCWITDAEWEVRFPETEPSESTSETTTELPSESTL